MFNTEELITNNPTATMADHDISIWGALVAYATVCALEVRQGNYYSHFELQNYIEELFIHWSNFLKGEDAKKASVIEPLTLFKKCKTMENRDGTRKFMNPGEARFNILKSWAALLEIKQEKLGIPLREKVKTI